VSEARPKAVDAFALGISARHRLLRDALGDTDALTDWIAVTVQRLVDAP
jgi:hypothetical protein